VDHWGHTGKNSYLVLFDITEIPFEFKALHHDVRTTSTERGKSPRKPYMPHWIDTKIHIVRS
jgi:hypothetical protein